MGDITKVDPADENPHDNEAEDIDASRAPLLEHLMELRKRLIYSFAGIFVAFVVCYYFAGDIYGFLVRPLAAVSENPEERKLIYTSLPEAFFTYIKVALFGALMISFPILANQIWMFIAPGLYRNEKRAFLPFLLATPVLFLLGASLAYYVVFPLAWSFFMSFETAGGDGQMGIELLPKVAEYLSLVMKLLFAFGLAFQLPVLLVLLERAGIVTEEGLRKKRKYAVVITFTAAAIMTPPDLISQIALGIPVLLLYELSIIAIRITRKREKAKAGS